jgi:CCR4-NOT transcription complex subunit 1
MFLPNLLLAKGQKGFGLAHQLLIDLFTFLHPYLQKGELDSSIRELYKGVLRVLLVLLHDFPEFLAEYHTSFVSLIPNNCIQLRNIFLSAFPRSMTLHDPFTPGLKIDQLPEIQQAPRILSNIAGVLGPLRVDLDNYLKNPSYMNVEFLNKLPSRLLNRSGDINPIITNALIVHLGQSALENLSNGATPNMHTPEMDIITKLMSFDDRNRYAVINCIANQLRFPNSHTHYWSCVLLFLFAEFSNDAVKEQITRVLLEVRRNEERSSEFPAVDILHVLTHSLIIIIHRRG